MWLTAQTYEPSTKEVKIDTLGVWTALIAGIAAFCRSWLAPFFNDKALANQEARTHKRKLLSDARETIQ